MTSATIKDRAFTFIELIIITVVLGVFIALSFPKIKHIQQKIELESFVRDIYYLSMYLRDLSGSEQKVYCLEYNAQERYFVPLYIDPQTQESNPIAGRLSGLQKVPRFVEVSFQPDEESAAYFYPDGSAAEIKISFKNPAGETLNLEIKGLKSEISKEE
ncbi:MAG: hypothetical protein MUF05_02805 [Candidatus Omnitrophica bacterium]|jgi:type II secretory pathway pseudopilin PulG|nr:hypothetical protein [Candidatus Omnitrophota bacterium]